MSKPWGWVTGFFTYETTKSVVVKSWSVGIINRVVQLLIILYFVCYVFYREKAYQVRDSGIQSSVMTKVKGFGYVNNHVMDVADYVAPTQGSAVFCIITKLIVTENQFQGRCPEVESSYKCDSDQDCSKHLGSYLGNGVITGSCVKSSQGNRCEMVGWCPAEVDKLQVKPMMEVENFTIFIKNSIRFPRFNVTRGNFPSSLNKTYIRSCRYDSSHNRHCPIFKVGDVLRYTGQNLSTIGHTGGEIGINIQWLCNLDLSEERCEPHYSFTRLDAVFEKNRVSKGYNFRFAKYYKSENGTDFRTLHKAYAIRFDILVTGLAGKFDPIPTLINIVAAFTSVGLGSILCDLILLNFLTGADQYKARKFEEVSESQIKILLSQKSISQQSVKPVSNDSGAVSLNLDQQL
ncbi:P2X purinoceptor 3a isoform X1 [Esox lucius]|uniref:P2X purinoceptor n=1 Tax=Esox lucius TaxID=8010 RepID=A0A3P8ZBN3_ESOLU|nr:P2X purinoceptor 3a isoform X1 [Esox lucius]